MYAATPADGTVQGMQAAPQQMSYGGMAAGSTMPQAGGAYQVASAGGMQMGTGVSGQPQAADPMAYAKLAGYGQQGVLLLPSFERVFNLSLPLFVRAWSPASSC